MRWGWSLRMVTGATQPLAATVHLRFTSERGAAHPICDSLCLSLPPSIPPSASISEWFSSRNTLLRRQLKKSERSKQFSLMPSPLRPPSAYEDCLCLLPIVVSQPAESFEQVPQASKLPAAPPSMAVGVKIPRSGLGAAFPSSQPRVGRPRPPGAGFGRPSPSSSLRFGSWLRRRSLSA